jgi:hypothetical protein
MLLPDGGGSWQSSGYKKSPAKAEAKKTPQVYLKEGNQSPSAHFPPFYDTNFSFVKNQAVKSLVL